MEYGAIGICVAKISEAAELIKAGIRDILITGPVVTPKKIEWLMELLTVAPNLMMVVDHPDTITLLDSMLGSHGVRHTDQPEEARAKEPYCCRHRHW